MEKQFHSNGEADQEDIIERYVYGVTKNLPLKSRKDIEKELKTLIYDMLEERFGEKEWTKNDITEVLKELGNPRDLSEEYMDRKRYLIGPQYFSQYIMLLKIVIFSVILGMTIASFVEGITNNAGGILNLLFHWISGLLSGISSAFVWVTCIFAFFEYRGIQVKETSDDWSIDDLPQVPDKKARISKGGSISSIVFNILVGMLFTFAPQFIGVIHIGENPAAIPVFNLSFLEKMLPLFLLCIGLGILREIIKLLEGRYSLRVGVVAAVLDVIALIITIIIFTEKEMWNPDFLTGVTALYDFDHGAIMQSFWPNFSTFFAWVFVLAFSIDIIDTLYRSYHYSRR